MAELFKPDKSATKLQQDLGKYLNRAKELGAADARIIAGGDVVVDERVLAKCTYPKCTGYGTSLNCPPHAMSPELFRKVAQNFRYGILFKMEIPPEAIVGPALKDPGTANKYRLKLYEIVARVESEAFYDGYHLAVGFAAGSCKTTFCPDIECSGLTPGKGCRFPLKARSSMEAVGMDAYTMAARAGWDIYAVGKATSPSEIPYGVRLGLVLID